MKFYYQCEKRHRIESTTLHEEDDPCPARAESPSGVYGPQCGAPIGDAYIHFVDHMNEVERLRGLVVSAHTFYPTNGVCSCGWDRVAWSSRDTWQPAHRLHVAALLDGAS